MNQPNGPYHSVCIFIQFCIKVNTFWRLNWFPVNISMFINPKRYQKLLIFEWKLQNITTEMNNKFMVAMVYCLKQRFPKGSIGRFNPSVNALFSIWYCSNGNIDIHLKLCKFRLCITCCCFYGMLHKQLSNEFLFHILTKLLDTICKLLIRPFRKITEQLMEKCLINPKKLTNFFH